MDFEKKNVKNVFSNYGVEFDALYLVSKDLWFRILCWLVRIIRARKQQLNVIQMLFCVNVLNVILRYSDLSKGYPRDKARFYITTATSDERNVNYAAGKTKLVAWFVTNCNSRNYRMLYAQELSQFIQV